MRIFNVFFGFENQTSTFVIGTNALNIYFLLILFYNYLLSFILPLAK
jgi:hypothetical protein